MLTYINENFLHAPSTDLSREVVRLLVNLILAQATEVFLEKCIEEKKGSALVAKIATQAAAMYTSLVEEVKEFMGKGIFDRNWVSLIQVRPSCTSLTTSPHTNPFPQIKSKHFQSLSQFHRSASDSLASSHGPALSRLILAESLAKEASKLATSFSSTFLSTSSPTLPADAGASIVERTKAHVALCSERRAESQRENDLIYNAIIPPPEALPAIEKTVVAAPLSIQEVYTSPDVQKVIGPDLFKRLIPLSVHESASVYSEEKAKLVRGEVERAEAADAEIRSALDALGVREGLGRFKAMAEGEVSEDPLPTEVRQWRDALAALEESEPVSALMAQLNRLKDRVRNELDQVTEELDGESRECEMMRVKEGHLWTMEPSAGLSRGLRGDLKAHREALEAAAPSDQQVQDLWAFIAPDVKLLTSEAELEALFKAAAQDKRESLLDLDEASGEEEKRRIGAQVESIEECMGRIGKMGRERGEVLRDLKEKVRTHILVLARDAEKSP
jgi:hypothetical protein